MWLNVWVFFLDYFLFFSCSLGNGWKIYPGANTEIFFYLFFLFVCVLFFLNDAHKKAIDKKEGLSKSNEMDRIEFVAKKKKNN